MRFRVMTGSVSATLLLLLSGCATTGVIPPALYQQLDRSLTFAQLKDSPDSYRGRLILVGGEVLDAKLLKQGTRLVVLQLPLLDS
jgi:outer membrane lipoprotein